MAFSIALPNTQGLPSPQEIREAYSEWSPNPEEFEFRDLLPDKPYKTPFIGYDVKGSPVDALNENSIDSPPTPTPVRARTTVALTPIFKDRVEKVRPSDAVNQRALGALDEIDAWQQVADAFEDIAIATEVQQEKDRIAALTGTLQPVLHGTNGQTYTYPVQVYTPSVLWDNIAATVVADLSAMADKVKGWGGECTLYLSRTVAINLLKNTQLVTLLAGSVHAPLLGMGGTAGLTIENKAICEVLQIFTGIKTVKIYDKGWKSLNRANGVYTFNEFMPQKKVLLIATPPKGQKLGFFGLSPTTNLGGFTSPQPGKFLNSYDYSKIFPNGTYDLHGGFYGVPGIVFPNCVVVATVLP